MCKAGGETVGGFSSGIGTSQIREEDGLGMKSRQWITWKCLLFPPSPAEQDQNIFTVSKGITLLHQLSPTSPTSLSGPLPTHQGLKDTSPTLCCGEKLPLSVPLEYKCNKTNRILKKSAWPWQGCNDKGDTTTTRTRSPGLWDAEASMTITKGGRDSGLTFLYFKEYLPIWGFFFQFLF